MVGVIPDDRGVVLALDKGIPLAYWSPHSEYTVAVRNLCEQVLEQKLPDEEVKRSLMQRLWDALIPAGHSSLDGIKPPQRH
ncbi:MAG: hypothetical protein HZA95_00490 [Candidatus Vogelbacteria bacterium]|nr:hypothetical protein [Candidatus Vogelbacteria bacterium]